MRLSLRVRAKLVFAFAAIALVGALAGGAGAYYVRVLSAQTARTYDRTITPLNGLFALYGEALKLESQVRSLADLENVEAKAATIE
ncbi:MAG TPA: hypothetical protein P5165_12250, partial [Spirochaetia bacterium]|nr:hypothetical protein [Spirochaetia bacterium]